MILIVSNKLDVSVDFVVRELQRRNQPYFRINAEDIAERKCSCSFPNFSLQIRDSEKGVIDGSRVRIVWYRRPGNPFEMASVQQKPDPAIQRFVIEQWATWLEALEIEPKCRWINPSAASSQFENKIRQLSLAENLGFKIPRTLVSNDPERIRTFSQGSFPIVAKALFSPLLEGEKEDHFVFTERVSTVDLDDDPELSVTPTIFQEAITPKKDYRVTVIGLRIFAVRIDCPNEELIDWRVHKDDVKFIPVMLPADIEAKCVEYVRKAGLVFGAIDLLKRGDDWVFLEINPSGEWGWLQQPVGLPIAEALCDTFMEYYTQS